MSARETPDTQAAVTVGDMRAIIRSIVGTGIGLATLLLMLIGLVLQQNAAVNTRIDDVNANVNARIDGLNANVNARIDDLNANVNARFDDVNARIDGIVSDIRELRGLVIEAIKRTNPAN